ncbi:MAG: hypothetical protein LUQ07_08400 [Methanospirillum sp.]|nr:hypothetical protein [Methanospirillum sp.]
MITILRILIREDVLTFILGISLFIFVFSTIINISVTDQLYPEKVVPVHIYTRGDPDVPFFLGVIMKEGSNNAIILINQWEKPENQSDFLVSFAEPVQNIEIALQKKKADDGNRTRLLDFTSRRHIQYEKIYQETGNTSISRIPINPQEISHFYGIECNVRGITRKVSAFQKTVSVSLKTDPGEEIEGYKPVRNIIAQVVPPSDYSVENAMPEAVLLSFIGEHFSANEFFVDTTKTDLFVLYENRFIERDIRILEIILGMLLSLATYFIATGFIKMVAPLNISILRDDKEREMVMMVNQGRRYQKTMRRGRMR